MVDLIHLPICSNDGFDFSKLDFKKQLEYHLEIILTIRIVVPFVLHLGTNLVSPVIVSWKNNTHIFFSSRLNTV